jgi:hypothetical protein
VSNSYYARTLNGGKEDLKASETMGSAEEAKDNGRTIPPRAPPGVMTTGTKGGVFVGRQ